MTEREKFEQWARMPPRYFKTDRFFGDDAIWPDRDYMAEVTDIAWSAWQAAIDASTHKAIYEDEVCDERR